MEKKKKWYYVFLRDVDVDAPGKIRIKAPGVVVVGIMIIAILGGVLMFSSWSCGGCNKLPVRTRTVQ